MEGNPSVPEHSSSTHCSATAACLQGPKLGIFRHLIAEKYTHHDLFNITKTGNAEAIQLL